MVFLSLIVPFNKSERYLKDCLDSLDEQDLEDSEVILVINGCSEDISCLLNEFKNKLNLKILNFSEDLGVSKARNEGLEIASGKYVYFMDSDDYLYQNALEKLIEVARTTDRDFINGERINTAYIRDRFEEQKQIRNEMQLLQNEMTDLEYSLKMLVGTKTTYLEMLSVLHSLIKRDIIGDLRFDENIRYLSDYGFMLEVIRRSDSFIGVENAIYAKRMRDDSIHIPSLNQEEKENEFLMYAEAYHRAMDYARQYGDEKFSILEIYFPQKMLRYYLKRFAIRFYNYPEEEWRGVNFDEMVTIAQDFDVSNRNFLIRKEIAALKDGDKAKLMKYVRLRAARHKLKLMSKRRWIFKATIYEKFYNKRPVKKNKILFESFYGRYYSDSPKYLYEYIHENHGDEFECVWVLNKGDAKIPGNPKTVKRFSLSYYKHVAQSEYLIFNTRHPNRLKKKEDQKFMCTWHGTPLKRLGYDQDNIYLNNPRTKHAYRRDSEKWDYMISANKFLTGVLRSAFAYEGEIIEAGYPRNDILYNADEAKVRQIKEDLNLPADKKIILYAPTWRDDEYFASDDVQFTLKMDLDKLRENFQDEYVIILRMHYFISDNLDISEYEGFAYDVSAYDDIGELYLISDLLITDYSSVFFDYANLKRPMIFFAYDLEKYEDTLRGFYIDMIKTVPGPVLRTNDELVEAISNIDEIKREYAEKYDRFYDEYCYIDDGNASKRIFERIWK